jgi:hypothetical protein
MLREIGDLAEHASLTGALRGGEGQAAKRFNGCLQTLVTRGVIDEGMFSPIPPEEAEYGQIGVDARLLASYLDGITEPESDGHGRHGKHGKHGHHGEDQHAIVRLAPFLNGDDLSKLIKDQLSVGRSFDMHTLTMLAPFLDQTVLGDLVKADLDRRHRPEAPVPPVPPVPPEAVPSTPTVEVPVHGSATQEAPERSEMVRLIERLSNPNLSAQERHEITMKLIGFRE